MLTGTAGPRAIVGAVLLIRQAQIRRTRWRMAQDVITTTAKLTSLGREGVECGGAKLAMCVLY